MMKSLKSQNFYDVLGVSRQATPEEIRSAYEISRHTFQENSLATYSLFSDAENQEILKLISKAFETLFNTDMRRAYDASLEIQEGSREGRADGGRPEGGRTEGGRVERERADPGRGEFSRSELGRTELGRTELSRMDHSRADLGRAEPGRLEAARTDLGRMDMARSELGRAEPRPQELRAGSAAAGGSAAAAGSASAAGTPVRARAPEEVKRPPVSTPAPAANTQPGTSAQPDAAVDEFLRGVATFDGATLRKLRQMRGFSLDQLAEQTKIRRAYLEYIEGESFQFLPAAVYVKGFLTIMATLMRLPVQRICTDYMVIFNAKKKN